MRMLSGAATRMQTPVPQEIGDGELAARVARGDSHAAADLVNRYQPAIRGFLLRLTGGTTSPTTWRRKHSCGCSATPGGTTPPTRCGPGC